LTSQEQEENSTSQPFWDDSATLENNQICQQQKQHKCKKLLEKQCQQRLAAKADQPVNVLPNAAAKTPNGDSLQS
jgi:hypothetical protein